MVEGAPMVAPIAFKLKPAQDAAHVLILEERPIVHPVECQVEEGKRGRV